MGLKVTCVYLLFNSCVCNLIIGVVASEDDTNSVARGFDPKSMLSSLAGSLMSRGYVGLTGPASGASQVVSLNLTNLFVLVLLKALIFAAGSMGAGAWKGGYGRSNDDDDKFLTDEEILLFLSYLTGSPGDNGCLQKVGCLRPQQAKKYIAAGDMLLKVAKTLTLEPDANYEYVLQELQEAAQWGLAVKGCERFHCGTATANQTSYH